MKMAHKKNQWSKVRNGFRVGRGGCSRIYTVGLPMPGAYQGLNRHMAMEHCLHMNF